MGSLASSSSLSLRRIFQNLSSPCTFAATRAFSTEDSLKNRGTKDWFASPDELERRIFGQTNNASSSNDSFYKELERIEKAHRKAGLSSSLRSIPNSEFQDGRYNLGTSHAIEGVPHGKLSNAAMDDRHKLGIPQSGYTIRPNETSAPAMRSLPWGGMIGGINTEAPPMPGSQPPINTWRPRKEFETTTEEVLQKADFRNVRFLTNFITEAGLIVKRSKTKISAKAQRRVAREIKTARAFGLMPFTVMGNKAFRFGESTEDNKQYDF